MGIISPSGMKKGILNSPNKSTKIKKEQKKKENIQKIIRKHNEPKTNVNPTFVAKQEQLSNVSAAAKMFEYCPLSNFGVTISFGPFFSPPSGF